MNYGLCFQEDSNIHKSRIERFRCTIQPSNSCSIIFATCILFALASLLFFIIFVFERSVTVYLRFHLTRYGFLDYRFITVLLPERSIKLSLERTVHHARITLCQTVL